MTKWSGAEEYRNIGEDIAKQMYSETFNQVGCNWLGKWGVSLKKKHMKEELIEFYKLSEEDVKELEKNEKE